MNKAIEQSGSFLVRTGLGIMCIAAIIGALWLSFPGMFILGTIVDSHILHWELGKSFNNTGLHTAKWFIGVGTIFTPYIAYILGGVVLGIVKAWRNE